MGDKAETIAIKTVFGSHAESWPSPAPRASSGHLLGASGGVEAIVSILAMQHQVAPPTINLEHPDPECDLEYVPNEARPMKINRVLKNSFGFGGHNACLVLAKTA